MYRVPPAERAAVPPPPPAKNGSPGRPKPGEFRNLLESLQRAGKQLPSSDKEGLAGRLAAEGLPFEGASTERPVLSREGERDGEGSFGEGEGEPGAEVESMPAELEIEPLTELVVDPLSRALMQAGPPRIVAPEPREPAIVVHPELEQLLTKLVRRASFGGDGRRGTARLELGAGPLAGATLLVSAEGGELSIDLDLPPGEPAEPWRARIAERLSARGLTVRELNVR